MFSHPVVVYRRMVGDDQDAIQAFEKCIGQCPRWLNEYDDAASQANLAHANRYSLRSAELLREFQDFEGGRFPWIIDVFLVGNTQHADLTALKRFALLVEGFGYRRTTSRGMA